MRACQDGTIRSLPDSPAQGVGLFFVWAKIYVIYSRLLAIMGILKQSTGTRHHD